MEVTFLFASNLFCFVFSRTQVGTDPQRCPQDLAETGSPTFSNCEAIIQSLEGGSIASDQQNVAHFCNDGCPEKVVTLLKRLKEDCGFDISQIVSIMYYLLS